MTLRTIKTEKKKEINNNEDKKKYIEAPSAIKFENYFNEYNII